MNEKEKRQLVFRNEWKHNVNRTDYGLIRNRLMDIAQESFQAGLGGAYRVRSLPFEEPAEEGKKGIINGIGRKESFRIRYYNENPEYIRLEKVIRVGGKCGKRSTPLTEQECEGILSGEFDGLAESEDSLVGEFCEKLVRGELQPTTVADYRREAFVYRACNVRITMDSGICTGIPPEELLNIQKNQKHAEEKEVVILEVKYDCFLPESIRSAIRVKEKQDNSFSRYEPRHIFG